MIEGCPRILSNIALKIVFNEHSECYLNTFVYSPEDGYLKYLNKFPPSTQKDDSCNPAQRVVPEAVLRFEKQQRDTIKQADNSTRSTVTFQTFVAPSFHPMQGLPSAVQPQNPYSIASLLFHLTLVQYGIITSLKVLQESRMQLQSRNSRSLPQGSSPFGSIRPSVFPRRRCAFYAGRCRI